MTFILFDDNQQQALWPLTLTRSAADLLCGISTIKQKWERALKTKVAITSANYLQKLYGTFSNNGIYINSRLFPNQNLTENILNLSENSALLHNQGLVAFKGDFHQLELWLSGHENTIKLIEYNFNASFVNRPFDLFQKNKEEFDKDFNEITRGRRSILINKSNQIIGDGRVFAEEGTVVHGSIFNTENGNIYLAKNSVVMEGCIIRGPLFMGENSTLKMGAKIYGASSFGPHCKIGGEVNNSIVLGYSNKGHDGFLGNSVLGTWCNLGADTNTSNLKNNYDEVKLWNYVSQSFEKSGTQFCGLIMGDHSKCGINTMFNTGTVVGVSANVFGAGFPRNFIPSFSWGGAAGFATYKIEKALETAQRMMVRRGIEISEIDREIFKQVFQYSKQYRLWDKSKDLSA